jgi:sporulation protein YlmC with PRC-barrel domain
MPAVGMMGMPDVLARNLIDKAVIGSDGTELGTLSSVTMNAETGELGDLLITPRNETTDQIDTERDEDGRYAVSISSVQAVKDHIVVDR